MIQHAFVFRFCHQTTLQILTVAHSTGKIVSLLEPPIRYRVLCRILCTKISLETIGGLTVQRKVSEEHTKHYTSLSCWSRVRTRCIWKVRWLYFLKWCLPPPVGSLVIPLHTNEHTWRPTLLLSRAINGKAISAVSHQYVLFSRPAKHIGLAVCFPGSGNAGRIGFGTQWKISLH